MTTGDLFTRTVPLEYDRGAIFSPDRRYRYRLWRSWGDRDNRCVWVMVNPSTADETVPDQTITKCIGFAKKWGFTAIDVVNLFAFVSTDVRGLLEAGDPVGPDNDATIDEALTGARRIVLAWGSHAPVRSLIRTRETFRTFNGLTGTLGRNSDGSPRHPLMLAYDTPFEPLGAP